MKPKPCAEIWRVVRRPFTGAWIETSNGGNKMQEDKVAPSRGRGLKLSPLWPWQAHGRSPLHGGVD